MQHPELPIISFLCFVLVLAVLPSHLRAGSVATIALIVWLAIMSLIRGINSLIWADNFDIKIPVWCDITTKISVGFNFAVPAAALCILKHLESIASTRTVNITSAQKRRRQIFEGIMCFVLPLVFMALHYVVQGHRFDLYEYFGCQPTIYYSLAAIFLYYGPPLLMSCISFFFAMLSVYHFLRLRINFSLHLRNNNSAFSASRYFRLMAMAVVVNMWDTGINTYIITLNNQLNGGLRPWISWANVHFNWSFIQVVPTEFLPSSLFAQVLFVWWIIPISCFIFFIFFGFGSEAQADYRAAAAWIWNKVPKRKTQSSSVLPFAQSPIQHMTINTPTSYQSSRKPWVNSTSTTIMQEVKPTSRPTSLVSSTISSPSPSCSSNVHEIATSTRHPYAVLPEMDSGKPSADSLEESERLQEHNFPQKGETFMAETLVPGDVEAFSSPESRHSWYSSRSHDSQDCPPHNSDDETNNSRDFVIVPKTLSLEFVPRDS